jgi:hypothetical protein
MNKQYINPRTEIVKVEMQQHMLAGSTFSKAADASDFGDANVIGGTAGNDVTINSRRNVWDDEE